MPRLPSKEGEASGEKLRQMARICQVGRMKSLKVDGGRHAAMDTRSETSSPDITASATLQSSQDVFQKASEVGIQSSPTTGAGVFDAASGRPLKEVPQIQC